MERRNGGDEQPTARWHHNPQHLHNHRLPLFRFACIDGRNRSPERGGELSSAGREPVEQQEDRGVGHGAAAPPDVPLLRRLPRGRGGSLHRHRRRPLLHGSQLLLLTARPPPLAVAGGHRLPRPPRRGGELGEPQAGQVGRRR
jgi:hypothetical protein